jgi:hypothetical protein
MRYAELPLAAFILAAACALGLSLPRVEAPSPPMFLDAFYGGGVAIYEPIAGRDLEAEVSADLTPLEVDTPEAATSRLAVLASVLSAPTVGRDQLMLTFPKSELVLAR